MKVVLLQERASGVVHACSVGRWLNVGRSADGNDLVFDDPTVSRRHCRVRAEGDGRLEIADLSSTGTFLDGERLGRSGHAAAGAEVRLGPKVAFTVVGLLDPDASQAGELEPRPPRRIGAHFIVLRELGRGGMGIVYEAWDEARRRTCALKWLREGGRADAELMARFRQEALLQSQLSDYPGVVKFHDLGSVTGSGELYCTMELVRGESLLSKLQGGALPRLEAVRLVARVARAVAYAHERGILHRDLKPGNVMVTAEGQVRLTDFGIAKALDQGDGKTVTGIMLGTPGYMAPEQIQDAKRAGPPADIYALGAVLYTTLTGKLPFRGRSMREALENVMKGDVPLSPAAIDPTVDAELDRICARALAHAPSDRWPSAADLAAALEAWLRAAAPAPRVRLQAPPA